MDEKALLNLIASGESREIDFKRELELNTARQKSEFIKDIVALANSANPVSFLIVGIEDDGDVVGSDPLPETRIQQLIHSYVNPMPSVDCKTVELPSTGQTIEVVQITGDSKPYKIVRGIESLTQNDVYVRHGTVTAKASPEEIYQMRQASSGISKIQDLSKAAEIHVLLDNINTAIDMYSRAIEVNPSAELLIARGSLYRRQLYKAYKAKPEENQGDLAEKAFRDLTGALRISNSDIVQKNARLERLRLHHWASADYDEVAEDDSQWLINNAVEELGEVYFLSVAVRSEMVWLDPPQVVQCLTKAIMEGYEKPHVYDLRAEAHFYSGNYGLALDDLDKAFEEPEEVSYRVNYSRRDKRSLLASYYFD